jgi:hypothetical protein
MAQHEERRGKPRKTLSQLEEEPETAFYGLTFNEVKGVLKKVILVAIVAAVALSMLIRWEIATILGILIAIGIGWLIVRKTSSNRAGKPLYYHLHVRIWRSGRFIQPARRYQRERNHGCP